LTLSEFYCRFISSSSSTSIPDTSQDEAQCILNSLQKHQQIQWNPIRPLKFEKDDDNNLHIDFIHAASTLRALNYTIIDPSKASRLTSKLIAGRIIPAIVTTTAVVAGLECFELYKVIQANRKIDNFKNAFISLGIPQLLLSEPLPPIKHKYYSKEITEWDRVNIKPPKDFTLQALLIYFKKKLAMNVTSVSVGPASIYLDVNENHKTRLKSRFVPLVEHVTKTKFSPNRKWFTLFVTALTVNTGEPLEQMPKIYYWIPNNTTETEEKRNEGDGDE